ncbi:MAG: GNAT family N-acetyltransferase [Acidimicrobiales bacterium]
MADSGSADTNDEAWIDTLRQSPVGARLQSVSFEPGTTVARAGEPGRHFLVVLEGTASVADPETGQVIAEVGPGSIVGELALLTDGPRTKNVTVTKAMNGLVGDADAFDQAMGVDAFRTHVAGCAAQRLAASARAVPTTDQTGNEILVRPLLPTDRDAYQEALSSASRQTLVNRFFSGAAPSRAIIDYLLDVDCVRHFAWVAVDPTGPGPDGQGIGVARYIRDRDDPATAEWAVAVAETHRRRGIASLLLGALGVTALASGVETLTANVLSSNTAMRALLDEVGASWDRVEPGVVGTAMPAGRFAALFDPAAVGALEESISAMTHAATLALAASNPDG